jgi:hypothetical protein
MRDTLIILLLLAVVILGYFVTTQQHQIKTLQARPKTNPLELQEKCAKQAALLFKEDGWKAQKDHIASFGSHYNTKLNRCFIEIEDFNQVGTNSVTTKSVIDAFEGKPYGAYMWKSDAVKKYWEVPPMGCEVTVADGTKKTCKSADEFDELVRPYMEQ